MNILPEKRRGKLRKLLAENELIRAVETVNGMEAMIIENTCVPDGKGGTKGYDLLWFSSLCGASFRGKPDTEFISVSEKLRDIEDIFSVSSKPMIMDLDTGGNTEHLCMNIKTLERMGVSGIVIEDKKGTKRNSLYSDSSMHTLEDPYIFAEKINAAVNAAESDDFMIIARIESLIAGENADDALDRATVYIEAGADAVVIHSRTRDAEDIFRFSEEFKENYPDIPLIMIPTAYNTFSDTELRSKGADIIIYANHLMRSAYMAMQKTAEDILRRGNTSNADENWCAPVYNILKMIDGER